MGLPRANLNSPRGPHSQGNQWLCPSNTFCLLCSLHAAVTPRSFQSQNAYCNSEKSSLHWKHKFKNVGDSKNAFLHCRDVLALSKSCVCCAAAGKARRGPPGALPHAKGPDSKGKSQGVPIEGSFSFLCLHAAVALTPLLPKAHSLLLTSGTLSPVAPLVAELGLGTKPKRQVSSNASPKNREVADPAKGLGLAPEPWDHMTEAADASSSKICQADVSDELKGKSEQLIRRHPVQSGSLTGTDAQVDEQAVDLEPSSVQQSAVQQGQQKPVLYSGTASQLGSLQHDAQQSHCCQPAKQEVAPLQSAGSRRLESNSCTHQLQPLQSSACPQLQMDPQSELHSSTAQNAGNGVQPAPVRSQYASLHQGVELVSAPHHHTLPTRLLPLSISMAPGADGRLVKLDSTYERRQDAGHKSSLSQECPIFWY